MFRQTSQELNFCASMGKILNFLSVSLLYDFSCYALVSLLKDGLTQREGFCNNFLINIVK